MDQEGKIRQRKGREKTRKEGKESRERTEREIMIKKKRKGRVRNKYRPREVIRIEKRGKREEPGREGKGREGGRKS